MSIRTQGQPRRQFRISNGTCHLLLYSRMDLLQIDNADILAATGVSPTTIQTWANRGILAISAAQRNPGLGQKRLYSRLDAARIAVIRSLTTDHKLSPNAAGQIASRLERGPQGTRWREATEAVAGHIHLFIHDGDVVNIYAGNDIRHLAQLLTVMNEPTEAGVMAQGFQQGTQVTMTVALRRCRALRGEGGSASSQSGVALSSFAPELPIITAELPGNNWAWRRRRSEE